MVEYALLAVGAVVGTAFLSFLVHRKRVSALLAELKEVKAIASEHTIFWKDPESRELGPYKWEGTLADCWGKFDELAANQPYIHYIDVCLYAADRTHGLRPFHDPEYRYSQVIRVEAKGMSMEDVRRLIQHRMKVKKPAINWGVLDAGDCIIHFQSRKVPLPDKPQVNFREVRVLREIEVPKGDFTPEQMAALFEADPLLYVETKKVMAKNALRIEGN